MVCPDLHNYNYYVTADTLCDVSHTHCKLKSDSGIDNGLFYKRQKVWLDDAARPSRTH